MKWRDKFLKHYEQRKRRTGHVAYVLKLSRSQVEINIILVWNVWKRIGRDNCFWIKDTMRLGLNIG